MTNDIIRELNTCILLCTQLESLISQDEKKLEEGITGEVYRQYAENLWNLQEAVVKLKHQIYILHEQQQAIM